MSEIISALFSIDGLLIGLACGVVWLWMASQSRAARWALTGLLIVYLSLSVNGVVRVISAPLRQGFHGFSISDAPPAPLAIVVLGAGARTVHGRTQRLGLLTLGGTARVLEAARVFQLLNGASIVSSGGPPEGRDMMPESEVMRRALVELGVPDSMILLESESKSTRDESLLTAQILRQRGITSCIVVTSDTHMRRALGAFRRAGLNAVPAIATDPVSLERPSKRWVPTQQAVEFSQEVIHEYVGLAWYGIRGWQ
ncbi:MAG TPA: YdcF family protein [Vicinamibacterales bacterium]|nr:YdcF family protein [Vicinamibacterales bacterium]